MNGHSYGGRLNYLFLTGSCVIVLKNKDRHKVWEEYFYRYFKPNVHYIEVEYAEDDVENIAFRIEEAIQHVRPEEIAHNAFVQAKKVFQINEIYDVVYNKIKMMSHRWNSQNPTLEKSVFYTSVSPLYLYYRIAIQPKHTYTFHFQGVSFDILFETASTKYVFEFTPTHLNLIQDEQNIHQQPIKRSTTHSMIYSIQQKEKEVHVRILHTLYIIPREIELPLQRIGIRTTHNEGWWVI
jgi:hypothetical protein